MEIEDYLSKSITWIDSDDARNPWCTTFEGKEARVRINDFPAENLYTLIVGYDEINFDNWPPSWNRTG